MTPEALKSMRQFHEARRRSDATELLDHILEIELEVKRLREILQPLAKDWTEENYPKQYFAKEVETGDKIRVALSTPPPALAEAYVRLRDAVETMVKVVSPDTVQAVGRALDEVERREKGE